VWLQLSYCPAYAQEKPQAQLPDVPKPHTGKVFWAGVTALAAAETFDSIETRRMLNAGGSESHPFFGPYPSPARQAATAAALFGAEATIFHFTERSRHWYIRWPGRVGLGYMFAAHVRGGLRCAAYVRHQEKRP